MSEQQREAPGPATETPPPAAETPPPAPEGGERPAPRAARPEGERPERGEGDRDRGPRERGGRRHFGRRKVCTFCVEKVTTIDYKDPMRLRRFLSDRARIEPRRKTGTCAKHQRWLAIALKRARHLALLPYTPEHIRASGLFAGRR